MSMSRWLVPMIVCTTLTLVACGESAVAPDSKASEAPTVVPTTASASIGVSTCNAGYFDPDLTGTCYPAPRGTYVPTAGATAPTPCPVGYLTFTTGNTSCLPAPPGYYVPQEGSGQPTPCTYGTYQPNSGSASCLLADPGHKVPVMASTSQTPCVAGEYQPQAGQRGCIFASPGYFVPTTGATTQTACAAGTFSAVPGASACTPAAPGSYVPNSAMRYEQPCTPGTYQPAAGQTSCLPAGIGFYVDVMSATAQTACPAGTTTVATGATSIDQCVRLFAWQGFESPLDANAVNVAKAGSAVAIKFSLGADEGLAIFQAGFPSSAAIACTGGATTSAELETETAGQSTLTYDASSDQYKYIWKTEKGWSGTCRRLTIRFTDSSVRTVDFRFTK